MSTPGVFGGSCCAVFYTDYASCTGRSSRLGGTAWHSTLGSLGEAAAGFAEPLGVRFTHVCLLVDHLVFTLGTRGCCACSEACFRLTGPSDEAERRITGVVDALWRTPPSGLGFRNQAGTTARLAFSVLGAAVAASEARR